MSVCKCWDCGYEQKTATVEEARQKARLHMGLTPHLMCFGYTDADYKAKTIVGVKLRDGKDVETLYNTIADALGEGGGY